MSILPPGTEWPPRKYQKALDRIAHNDRVLNGIPQPKQGGYETPHMSRFQYNGGIAGATARMMLGKPQPARHGSATKHLHDELPAALATLSADVLVGTPPRFTVHRDDAENQPAVDALNAYTSTDRFASELHQAFRTIAGLGWCYGRIVWNADVQPQPWIEWVDPDQGLPEFANGRLVSVIFWDTYEKSGGKTYRLLQRHTPGRVDYELFEGKATQIGHPVPFTDIEETSSLAEIVDEYSGIDTGTQHLTAVYVPNLDRDHAWRTDTYLKHLATSDVHRGGDVWERLDKTWTDLMHEVDSARARMIVPEDYLQHFGPGTGTVFDWFRDIFPKPVAGMADETPTIDRVQFDMRVAEYGQTLQMLRAEALQAVGWSPITFGMDTQATGDITATEIKARSTRTLHTHKAKSRHARAALGELLTAWLSVDAVQNGYTPPERVINVSMTEPVEATEKDEAATIDTLRSAGVASLEYAVERLHPEWTPEEVTAEVARIRTENSAGDPFGYPDDEDMSSV